MEGALDLVREQQESSNTARFQIEEIDLSRRFGLIVTDRNGLQVLFGLDEMDRQLKRLDVYLQAIDQRAQRPQTINLLVERNVPVTFVVDALATDKPAPGQPGAAASPAPGGAAGAPKDKAAGKPKSHGPDKLTEKTRAKPNSHKGQPFLDDAAHDKH